MYVALVLMCLLALSFSKRFSLFLTLSLSLSLSMGALPGEPERRDPLLGTLENT